MIRLIRLTPRQILIVLHDLAATAAAILLTFVVRFEGHVLAPGAWPALFLPVFLVYAAVFFFIFDLHRNKWRFTSVPDLYNIFRASTVLAVQLLALDYVLLAPNVYGQFFFGKITILLYWFLQMFLLGGSRVAYRYFHYARAPARPGRRCDADPGARPRRRRRSLVTRHRKRRGKEDTGRSAVLSSSPADRGQVDPRHSRWSGDIDDLERVGRPTFSVAARG